MISSTAVFGSLNRVTPWLRTRCDTKWRNATNYAWDLIFKKENFLKENAKNATLNISVLVYLRRYINTSGLVFYQEVPNTYPRPRW